MWLRILPCKNWIPIWIPSGLRMLFDVNKVTTLVFIWRPWNFVVSVRFLVCQMWYFCLPIQGHITLIQAEWDLFHLFNVEWLAKVVFLEGLGDTYQKTRKNWFSLDWIPGIILKLQSKSHKLSSQSNLQWVCCLTHAFRKKVFIKLPLDCGHLRTQKLVSNFKAAFWNSSFMTPYHCQLWV